MAQYLRSYGKAKLLNPLNLVNAPPTIFLPTLGSKLQAVNRSYQSQKLRPRSTKLTPPTSFNPPLFVPTLIKPLLYANSRATQSSLRKPLSTKLRPPQVINLPPNLFLPTLGSHLNATQRARDASKFRGKSQLFQVPFYDEPAAFLPTLGRHLQSVQMSRLIMSRFKYEAKLFPATKINAAPNLFLPTLGDHLVAVTTARDRYKFTGKSQRLGIPYILLRKPPFLPTRGRYLQAIQTAFNQRQKKPYSTKLRPPSVVHPILVFLPSLGRYSYAINKAEALYRARQYSTKLRHPQVVNPYIPVLPSFTPNYELPVDTLWSQNPTYLQGAVDYDDPNTLYDAIYPFDGAVTGNITSVYPATDILWDSQDYDGTDTLWSQNPNYLEGATLYDASVTYDAVIPYDGTDNLVSVYPSNDTIWSGNPDV